MTKEKLFNFVIIEGYISSCSVITQKNNKAISFKAKMKDNIKWIAEDKLAKVCERYLEIRSHVLVTGVLSNGIVNAKEVKFLPKENSK